MSSLPKRLLAQSAPTLFEWLRSARFLAHCRRQYWEMQCRVGRKLFPDGAIRVLSGPFAGMRYFNRVVWGPIGPKWAGTYEVRLHPVVLGAIAEPYARVINVGCAEGYYAVGLARACPGSEVVAHDLSPQARARARELAAMNEVSNLVVRGSCEAGAIHPAPTGRTLVVCDIEGGEYTLLDLSRSRGLFGCDVLVECHADSPRDYRGATDALAARFEATHEIQRIPAEELTPEALRKSVPEVRILDEQELLHCLRECRTRGRGWLWMRLNAPRTSVCG